jgi:hypothetical protein
MPDSGSAERRVEARRTVEDAVARWPAGILLPTVKLVEVLTAFGLPVVPMRAVASLEQALGAAEAMGYPVRLRVPGSMGVEVGGPEAMEAAWPAHAEVLVQVALGPTRPAELWTPGLSRGIATLRAALPEMDVLDLVVEVDASGREWIVEAHAHVRAVAAGPASR